MNHSSEFFLMKMSDYSERYLSEGFVTQHLTQFIPLIYLLHCQGSTLNVFSIYSTFILFGNMKAILIAHRVKGCSVGERKVSGDQCD